ARGAVAASSSTSSPTISYKDSMRSLKARSELVTARPVVESHTQKQRRGGHLVTRPAGWLSILAVLTLLPLAGCASLLASAPAAVATGTDLRTVAGLVNMFPYRLMADPSVESAADLRGGRVVVGHTGSASDGAARVALRGLGLEPGTDVTLLQIGSAPERQ